MTFFFFICYNVIRVPLFVAAKIAGLFNAKISATLSGRKNLFAALQQKLAAVPADAPRLWIHASSMGEYEQALPLVSELLKRNPALWIVLTLFSPSVYKYVAEASERSVIVTLPFDSPGNVKRFLALVKPAVYVIIRHDIWPNYQWYVQRLKIPSVLADAGISDERLKSLATFRFVFSQIYKSFSAVCAVSEMQADRIKSVFPHLKNLHVCGDTRYDRVRHRALENSRVATLQRAKIFTHQRCLVVGSSWPRDEEVIFPAIVRALDLYKDFTLVIAPHELTPGHLAAIEQFFEKQGAPLLRLSQFEEHGNEPCRVLLVDQMGLLANLYALGAIAYVGGAFGMGVHSVLEPAAHGALICHGPRYLNSHEAGDMVSRVSVAISTDEEFESFLFAALEAPEKTVRRGKKTLEYMQEKFGASSRTADIIENYIF